VCPRVCRVRHAPQFFSQYFQTILCNKCLLRITRFQNWLHRIISLTEFQANTSLKQTKRLILALLDRFWRILYGSWTMAYLAPMSPYLAPMAVALEEPRYLSLMSP